MDILTQASLVAAGAVLLIQQILKLKIVPISIANRWPVETNIVLSIIATVVTFNWVNVDLVWDNWTVLVKTFGIIAVGAALAYNQLVSRSALVQKTEG